MRGQVAKYRYLRKLWRLLRELAGLPELAGLCKSDPRHFAAKCLVRPPSIAIHANFEAAGRA